jgi:diaminopimelate decarboxylase
MKSGNLEKRFWWERQDLCYRDNTLCFGNQNLIELANAAGTPLFVYNLPRVKEKLLLLQSALESQSLDFRIFYAMKANRSIPLLTALKMYGLCGIDACSPGELLLARQVGFQEEEISFTGTSVSNDDLDCLRKHPKAWVNCDSISSIRRLGVRCPGRKIGIRVNLGIGIGYNEMLNYAGTEVTKFGIYRDDFEEALKAAKDYDLDVKGLHFHSGSGYLNRHLPIFEKSLEALEYFSERVPNIEYINLGGGLGTSLVETDEPLDLTMWSDIIARTLGTRNYQILVEPGDFLVRDSGIMILEVNTVEKKRDKVFVGVDGGFNIQNEPTFYNLPLEVTPLRLSHKSVSNSDVLCVRNKQVYTIAGNINEAIDIFAKDVRLSPVNEGDYLAFLNAGSYGAALSSNHCMRGQYSEYILI